MKGRYAGSRKTIYGPTLTRAESIEDNYFQTVRRFNYYKKILPKYRCHISRFGPEGWSVYRQNLFFVQL